MVLSDRSIKEEIARGRIKIKPLGADCIQPASVDIRLDGKLRVFREWQPPFYIDLRQPLDGLTELVCIEDGEHFALQSGMFALGSTMEYIEIPDDIMARLEGKSSLGRIGLLIHATAGYVDPGWRGHLTLELFNVSKLPILLYAGMKISQISFHRLTTPAERPYGTAGLGSKYQGQIEPTPTQYFREFEQPTLLSLPSIGVQHARAREREPQTTNNTLWEWLRGSKFNGSVRLFAQALNIKLKTVEDWFYRGAQPSEKNRLKIFRLTELAEFAPQPRSSKSLLPE